MNSYYESDKIKIREFDKDIEYTLSENPKRDVDRGYQIYRCHAYDLLEKEYEITWFIKCFYNGEEYDENVDWDDFTIKLLK